MISFRSAVHYTHPDYAKNFVLECAAMKRVREGRFDGFSIGSSDPIQLTPGIDRDCEILDFDYDERRPGVTSLCQH